MFAAFVTDVPTQMSGLYYTTSHLGVIICIFYATQQKGFKIVYILKRGDKQLPLVSGLTGRMRRVSGWRPSKGEINADLLRGDSMKA